MSASFITKEQVTSYIQKRPQDSHKGTFGNVLAVCGSNNMGGAAYFASAAALRCGAGLVTLALPKRIYPTVLKMLPEAVYLPLSYRVSPLKEKIKKANSIVIGCGLGQSYFASKKMQYVLKHCNKKPLVIDADGLNWIAKQPSWPINTQQNVSVCITPHPAEMARLMHCSIQEIENNREQCAQSFADQHNVVVVLKGHHTVVAYPHNEPQINPTGCSGMATGGSGDVLAGMIASFIAQGLSIEHAAKAGVYLHGLAGENASANLSEHGMLPSDMLNEISTIFKNFE